MKNRLISSSSFTGSGVTNLAGENLGDVKDFMIDADSGNIAYVVLSFGGFLGMGDKLFAIPFEAFTIDMAEEKIILDFDKEKLENAPGFDKDNWPSGPQREYIQNVHDHFGMKPYWERERLGDDMGSERSGSKLERSLNDPEIRSEQNSIQGDRHRPDTTNNPGFK